MAAAVLLGRALEVDVNTGNLLGSRRARAARRATPDRPATWASSSRSGRRSGSSCSRRRYTRGLPRLPLRLDLAIAASVAAQCALAPLLAAQFHRLTPAAVLLNIAAVPLSGARAAVRASPCSWRRRSASAASSGGLAWLAARALRLSGDLGPAAPWLDIRVPGAVRRWRSRSGSAGSRCCSGATGVRGLALARSRCTSSSRSGPWARVGRRAAAPERDRRRAGRRPAAALAERARDRGRRRRLARRALRPWRAADGAGAVAAGRAAAGRDRGLARAPRPRGRRAVPAAGVSRRRGSSRARRRSGTPRGSGSTRRCAGRASTRLCVARGARLDWDGARLARARARSRPLGRRCGSATRTRWCSTWPSATSTCSCPGTRPARPSARCAPPSSLVVKVPHHGSRTSSSEPLVAATSARLAIVSCGARNPFGHPHPEVAGALARRPGALVLGRTGTAACSWRPTAGASGCGPPGRARNGASADRRGTCAKIPRLRTGAGTADTPRPRPLMSQSEKSFTVSDRRHFTPEGRPRDEASERDEASKDRTEGQAAEPEAREAGVRSGVRARGRWAGRVLAFPARARGPGGPADRRPGAAGGDDARAGALRGALDHRDPGDAEGQDRGPPNGGGRRAPRGAALRAADGVRRADARGEAVITPLALGLLLARSAPGEPRCAVTLRPRRRATRAVLRGALVRVRRGGHAPASRTPWRRRCATSVARAWSATCESLGSVGLAFVARGAAKLAGRTARRGRAGVHDRRGARAGAARHPRGPRQGAAQEGAARSAAERRRDARRPLGLPRDRPRLAEHRATSRHSARSRPPSRRRGRSPSRCCCAAVACCSTTSRSGWARRTTARRRSRCCCCCCCCRSRRSRAGAGCRSGGWRCSSPTSTCASARSSCVIAACALVVGPGVVALDERLRTARNPLYHAALAATESVPDARRDRAARGGARSGIRRTATSSTWSAPLASAWDATRTRPSSIARRSRPTPRTRWRATTSPTSSSCAAATTRRGRATGPGRPRRVPAVAATSYYNLSLAHLQKFEYQDYNAAKSSADRLAPGLVSEYDRWRYDTGDYAVVDLGLARADVWDKFKGADVGRRRAEPAARHGSTADVALARLAAEPLRWCALAIFALAGLLVARWRGRKAFTLHCRRCGTAFCRLCHLGQVSGGLCSQCYHLFVVRDGVSAPVRNRKLAEVQRGRQPARARDADPVARLAGRGTDLRAAGRCAARSSRSRGTASSGSSWRAGWCRSPRSRPRSRRRGLPLASGLALAALWVAANRLRPVPALDLPRAPAEVRAFAARRRRAS